MSLNLYEPPPQRMPRRQRHIEVLRRVTKASWHWDGKDYVREDGVHVSRCCVACEDDTVWCAKSPDGQHIAMEPFLDTLALRLTPQTAGE